MQPFAKFKKILPRGFRASLNFRQVKVAPNPLIFLSSTAICKVPCQNGGTCAKPNQCKCPYGYKATTCGVREYTVYLRTISFITLFL